jgi:hypothetical protein
MEAYQQVNQLDEVSKELAGKVVNARIAATSAAADRENKYRTTQNVRDTVAAADKEARAKKLAAGVRRRRDAEKNEEFELWVDSLIEEGYDLSEYTWDEMYDIYEAEGSYGQTPKARSAMGKLAVSRMRKPASEYSQRGEKTKKVKAAEKHTRRQDRLASGNNRYGSRGPMDQARRNWSRGADDYGHSGYDGEGYGGSVTKNPKKLRKQKAMGEIKESYDAYELVFSYLLDEGFASTEEAADKIILNMSEAWFEDIMELNRYEKKTGKDYKTGKEVKKGGTMGGDDTNSKVMRHMHKVMGAGRMGVGGAIQERGKKKDRTGKVKPEAPAVSPAQKVAKRREDKKRGEEMMHSRYD